ncbi:hypothetical protein [Undibacterium curvum]|uniref:Uncharacterized protein n=1 Tax=Undibacterium curvum TaxID=2762294 RepID=A0ABR7A6Y5_9BURK|nr:hypothetical protein [Undibacterium curvum]MBC3932601.1 hypothetical protein [Undibacterium curvum]
MPIGPIRNSTIDSAFKAIVTTSLGQVNVLTCGHTECNDCYPHAQNVHEFVHYSRDLIQDWKKDMHGNQLCWSQYYADKHDDIALITDQPGRNYQMLCLIKVSACKRLHIRSERGDRVEHFALNFAVPAMNMVRIQLHPNADQTGYII